MATFERPLDFSAAFAALRELMKNPDDTKQAFRIAQALSGNSGERLYRRFLKTAVGRSVVAERRVLLDRLKDREALQALPEGSLGRAYLDFLRSQQITAEGLVDASQKGYREVSDLEPNRQLLSDRLRDMHDLWHTVTGYKGDLIGEAALLALTFVQTRNPGVGLIALMALLRSGPLPGARRAILEGVARGVRSAWLVSADWERMLAEPLSDVREELRLGAPPKYQPIYTSDPGVREALAAA
jgi:ubiquinone biosynthesis protein COQ4